MNVGAFLIGVWYPLVPAHLVNFRPPFSPDGCVSFLPTVFHTAVIFSTSPSQTVPLLPHVCFSNGFPSSSFVQARCLLSPSHIAPSSNLEWPTHYLIFCIWLSQMAPFSSSAIPSMATSSFQFFVSCPGDRTMNHFKNLCYHQGKSPSVGELLRTLNIPP